MLCKGSTFFYILQKKWGKICVIRKNILLLHPLNRKRYVHCWYLVRWMSGLVFGLQNRPGRFDSATHLEGKELWKGFIFCLFMSRRYGRKRRFFLTKTRKTLTSVCVGLCSPLRCKAYIFLKNKLLNKNIYLSSLSLTEPSHTPWAKTPAFVKA